MRVIMDTGAQSNHLMYNVNKRTISTLLTNNNVESNIYYSLTYLSTSIGFFILSLLNIFLEIKIYSNVMHRFMQTYRHYLHFLTYFEFSANT